MPPCDSISLLASGLQAENQTDMLIRTQRQPETHTAFPLECCEIYLTLPGHAGRCRQILPSLQQLADGEHRPFQANSLASWHPIAAMRWVLISDCVLN
jgi:hypothetical protein